jgi:hemolysin III
LSAAPSHREELANALTHGVGVVASVAGGAALITLAAVFGNAWQIASATVFVTCLILLYTASTLYHSFRDETIKRRLKVLDHCAIYLLIAGTYTPFTLIALRGVWGWSLFGVVWTLALAGVIFKLYFTGRFKLVSTLLYIAMGWIVVVAIVPLWRSLTPWALGWLFAGGISYTAGTFFYHNPRVRYSHAIWHLFVLAGSAMHFAAVVTQVAYAGGGVVALTAD